MKKIILAAAAFCLCSITPALAGGFLTNTNQSASFGRMFALDGYVSVEGAYYNPAGVGFLGDGWHLAVNNQSAFQTRTALSTFQPYAFGFDNAGATTKKYKGTAKAPILPALDVAYVRGRWFGSAHVGIVGGGGKAEFAHGLGTFESVVSMVPTAFNAITSGMGLGAFLQPGYTMDSYMRGKQFIIGGQFGVGYKVLPELAVSLGGRVSYATSNYYGYVRDIRMQTSGALAPILPAGTELNVDQLVGTMAQLRPDIATQITTLGSMVSRVEVNCDQSGWGFAPILGIDYKKGPLTVGARYEFKTRLRLKNTSTTDAQQAALLTNLAEFEDGRKVPNDIPALLGVGVGYEFTPRLRANLAAHYFFDKQAHQFGDKQKLLAHNTWELLAGVEYDVSDRWTVSAGGQSTNYGLGKEKRYISDLSFVTSSYSLGAGAKFRISDRVGLNFSYFKTFYYSTRKTQQDYNHIGATSGRIIGLAQQQGLLTPEQAQATLGQLQGKVQAGELNLSGNDLFDRTNDVVAIGVDIRF